MSADPDHFPTVVTNAGKTFSHYFRSLARVFQVEELAVAAMEDSIDIVTAVEPEAILALRKEGRQLVRVIRWTSFYMLAMSLVYLIQSILCLEWMDLADFEAKLENKAYAAEIYNYSMEFEKMKVVHALTLTSISAFITIFTLRRRTLNQMHYWQLLILSLVVSFMYFVPLLYIGYMSFDSKYEADRDRYRHSARPEWEKAMIRFADWFFMLLRRSDLGWWGVGLSLAVHIQIYISLLVMQWCAWHIRTVEQKIAVIQDASQGTYQGVEMQSAEELQRQNATNQTRTQSQTEIEEEL